MDYSQWQRATRYTFTCTCMLDKSHISQGLRKPRAPSYMWPLTPYHVLFTPTPRMLPYLGLSQGGKKGVGLLRYILSLKDIHILTKQRNNDLSSRILYVKLISQSFGLSLPLQHIYDLPMGVRVIAHTLYTVVCVK